MDLNDAWIEKAVERICDLRRADASAVIERVVRSIIEEEFERDIRQHAWIEFAKAALGVWVQAHVEQTVDDLALGDVVSESGKYADAMLTEMEKLKGGGDGTKTEKENQQ